MNTDLIIKFKLLYPDSKPPVRAKHGDAGWDLSIHGSKPLNCGGVIHMTGIAVEIPYGYFGLLRPRSSICNTAFMFHSSGIIDSGFRGEIGVPMKLIGSSSTHKPGERIAQIVILPLPDVYFVRVDELSDSERATGGFGSSGNL